jgi:NAD(P)-dependent dehydrogenase (short-subunit alcohol dehydrogenase family)
LALKNGAELATRGVCPENVSATSEFSLLPQLTAASSTTPSGTAKLHDRSALITGASGGIAAATARRFAREGAKLALSDLNPAGAEAVAKEIRAEGGSVTVVTADVTKSASVERMCKAASDAMGGLDILVTCAGGYTATLSSRRSTRTTGTA